MNNDNSLLDIFSNIEDPRIESKSKHLVVDIFIITICAILSNADDWVAISEYGKQKYTWLNGFLRLPHGIPSHDTFGRFFSIFDEKQLNEIFIKFTNFISKKTKGDIISIDGKTIRGSFDKASGKNAIHMVSAWSNKNGICLGQLSVDNKTNEITVVPELIKKLCLEGCIVTGDAMNCQKKIATEVINKKGDYVFALKGNHGDLFDDIKYFFDNPPSDKTIQFYEETNKDHGRIEIRRCGVCDDISWLQNNKDWLQLKSIVVVEYQREVNAQITIEKRYYISSLSVDAKQMNHIVKSHWSIENSLHWVLDVIFKEDFSRIRIGNAAKNLSCIRKISLALLKKNNSLKNKSLKVKRQICAWNNEYLLKTLFYTNKNDAA